jgi:hypothetical protein
MNILTRSLFTLAAAILALVICSLTPVPLGASPTTMIEMVAPSVADAVSADQPEYDAYALDSPYDYMDHNCPPENCGTGDQCGLLLPPGAACGTLPNCTCKKCHNWGVCTRN